MKKILYCPLCLSALDSNQECWPVCNYEAQDAKLGYEPLSKIQMLQRRISETKQYLTSNENHRKILNAQLDDFEKQLAATEK